MYARQRLLPPALALLLAACASVPPDSAAPAPPPRSAARFPHDERGAAVAASHRQLATQFAQRGDLAAAAREWHIVTLLDPDDEAARAELAATRTAIRQRVREHLQAAGAAERGGDADRATAAWLKALALDPENAEATKALREIDRKKLARIQSVRAARANQANAASRTADAPANAKAGTGESYDIDQRIEMFRAGDVSGGLQELRAYVDANPNDHAARQRIATTVYERGRELEASGAREPALNLYEQAMVLRGKPVAEWTARSQSLRKAISDEYYEKGMHIYRTDIAGAIRLWETSVRYDPQNAKAASKLQEARTAQDKLLRMHKDPKQR